MPPSRQAALAATLVVFTLLTALVLWNVLATVVFAVTLASVLLPVRRAAVERGASRRIAAATATTLASAVAVAFVAPLVYVLYRRRDAVVSFVESLPTVIPVTVGDRTYPVEVEPIVDTARDVVTGIAIDVAAAAPVIVLKALVLVLLVYGLLYKPSAVRTAATRVLPEPYHEPLFALDRRAAETLEAIYVLQAATAAATFVLATLVFWALGYSSPIVFGVIAGVLQFIPVLGPSVLVVAVAALDFAAGDVPAAVTVLAVGLVVVGFLPDAVIRTRLAEYTTELPVSLYFVGFVGGVLTVGAVGFVLGPLVVALLVETVLLLSDGVQSAQQRLDERPAAEPVSEQPPADAADSRREAGSDSEVGDDSDSDIGRDPEGVADGGRREDESGRHEGESDRRDDEGASGKSTTARDE